MDNNRGPAGDERTSWPKRHEQTVAIAASAEEVFAYVDDHARFSAHMNRSSWMMAGSLMQTEVDTGGGQRVGSHIRMNARVLGVQLSLDEVVTRHEPPYLKT